MARDLPRAGLNLHTGFCPQEACHAPLELPYLCGVCGQLLRSPPGLTHFERFGIEPTFDVDLEALEARYFELSRQLHPDRMINRSAKTQSRALVLSSALNESYDVLKDERLRAEHLLRIHGGPCADGDRRTPQELLLEMMDLHEELEEAKGAGDTDRLRRMLADAHTSRDACMSRVREMFDRSDFPNEELLAEIRLELNVAKYWTTLVEELQAAL